tara:strand:- start:374 stop:1726 length:1353 start_codon:yes stop_codon:yes gene_type:complete
MRLAVDCSTVSTPIRPRGRWLPPSLFDGGIPGLWLDARVPGVLFQDVAATLPVSAYGQPVGLLRDVSGNGNDAFQSVSARRPTFSRHPASGPRNLLLHSNRFDLSPWTSIWDRAPDAGPAPDSSNSATLVTTTGAGQLIQPFLAGQASGYTYSIHVKAGNAATPSTSFVIRNLSTATNSVFATLTWSTMTLSVSSGAATIAPVGNGWFRMTLTATSGYAAGHTLAAYAGSAAAAGLTYWLWGAQVEAGTTATPLQTVTVASDMTEPGQADVPHLLFDGVDDRLESAPVDFGSSGTLSAVTAVRSEATGVLVEAGPNAALSDGGFALLHGGAATNDVTFVARTTLERERVSIPPIPGTNRPLSMVASAVADPTGSPRTALWVNDMVGQIRDGTLQPGTFGLNAIWIGARADGSAPFRGRFYGAYLAGRGLTVPQRLRVVRHFKRAMEGLNQ